jgi:hypothetical protein
MGHPPELDAEARILFSTLVPVRDGVKVSLKGTRLVPRERRRVYDHRNATRLGPFISIVSDQDQGQQPKGQ